MSAEVKLQAEKDLITRKKVKQDNRLLEIESLLKKAEQKKQKERQSEL